MLDSTPHPATATATATATAPDPAPDLAAHALDTHFWLDRAYRDDLSPAELAELGYVLHHFGVPDTIPGGRFIHGLLVALDCADLGNRARLAAAFPALVGFYHVMTHTNRGRIWLTNGYREQRDQRGRERR